MKALVILTALFALALAVPAQAVIVGVDFNNSTGTPNQTGFNAFNIETFTPPTSQTYTTPEGNLTVTLTSGEIGDFFRGGYTNSGAFTYADLLNDFTYTNVGTTIGFELSGPALLANTPYTITIWGVDSVTVETQTVSPTGGTTGTPGTIVDDGSTPTDNTAFSTTVVFTSDSSGLIDFADFNAGDTPRINGFQIDLVTTPEPASAGLLLIGGMPLLARRRRAV